MVMKRLDVSLFSLLVQVSLHFWMFLSAGISTEFNENIISFSTYKEVYFQSALFVENEDYNTGFF